MLTILLVALALYIFWLLFRNGPAFAERVPNKNVTGLDPHPIKKNGRAIALRSFSHLALKLPSMPSLILPILSLRQTPFPGR